MYPNATHPGSHYWGQPWLAAAAALTDYMFTCPNKRAAATLANGVRPTAGRNSSSTYLSNPRPPVFLVSSSSFCAFVAPGCPRCFARALPRLYSSATHCGSRHKSSCSTTVWFCGHFTVDPSCAQQSSDSLIASVNTASLCLRSITFRISPRTSGCALARSSQQQRTPMGYRLIREVHATAAN